MCSSTVFLSTRSISYASCSKQFAAMRYGRVEIYLPSFLATLALVIRTTAMLHSREVNSPTPQIRVENLWEIVFVGI